MADIISHAGAKADFDPATLAGVEPVRRIAGRNATKADILFFDLDGERVALKTYARRSILIRNTLGRWLIRREASAYEAAEGIPAVPALLGRVGPYGLATRWVDAEQLRERTGDRLDEAIFDRLAAQVGALHERGVALADLHHRDVLLGADDRVYIVDLAMSWVLGRRPGRFRRRVFERFCEFDRVNLSRMRARFTCGDIDAAAATVSPRAAAWHRWGRWLKSCLNRLRGRR